MKDPFIQKVVILNYHLPSMQLILPSTYMRVFAFEILHSLIVGTYMFIYVQIKILHQGLIPSLLFIIIYSLILVVG